MAVVSLDERLGAWRATDAFVLEVFAVAAAMRQESARGLAQALRRAALAAGGAVVAASAVAPGDDVERELLVRARGGLVEGRYYLSIARRLALLDARRHRGLALRLDAALREIEQRLAAPRSSGPGRSHSELERGGGRC